MLSGCASHEKQQIAETLAKSRAAAIDSKAPYPKIDAYQITQAYASGSTVKINVIYGGKSRVSPSNAVKAAARNYCNNKEIKPLFDSGVDYLITIKDISGRTMAQQTVSKDSCESLN
nr:MULTISPECIES: type II secretion system pilot lipoprotein GspS-beta [unclassified Photobacterium]